MGLWVGSKKWSARCGAKYGLGLLASDSRRFSSFIDNLCWQRLATAAGLPEVCGANGSCAEGGRYASVDEASTSSSGSQLGGSCAAAGFKTLLLVRLVHAWRFCSSSWGCETVAIA